MAYTVRKLAILAGVSIRTLHHYDEIGLLKPAYMGANGYRYYEEEELLLLQQILFFKNLGFTLSKIREIIKKSDFDRIRALHSHRKMLMRDLGKTRELIETIDNTIKHLQGEKKMKDKEFFKGLESPKQKVYEEHLIKSGRHTREEIDRGRKRLEKWSKEDWQATQAEWESLLNDYVSAIQKGISPDSSEGHDLVVRHLQYLKRFGIEVQNKDLVERANFYLGHPDWKKVLDARHPELLNFILSAMEAYAKKD